MRGQAVENLNGFSVRGHVLEVVYKKDNEPFWFQGSGALENHPNRSLTPPNQTLYTADGQPLTGEYPVPYPHHSTPSSVQASQSFVGTTPNMPQIYHTAPTNDYSQGYSGYQRNDNPPGRFPQGQLLNHIPHGSIQQNGFNSQHSVHYDQMHGQNYRPPNMPMGYGSQPTPQQFRQQPQNHGFTMPQRVIYPQAPQYYEYPHPAQQYSMNPMPYSGQFTNGYPAQMQPPQPNQFGIGQGYGVTSNPTMSNGSASTRRNSGDSQIFVPYNTEIPIPSSPAATNAVTEKSFIAEPIEVPPAEKPEDPCNLFVKNLPKDITDGDELKALFEKFGTIVSAHLPVYEGSNTPRGYGFVLFSTPEEARNALKEMNEKMLGNKRLFVHYYENKENRTKRLAVLFHGDVDIANAANATPEEDSADKILSEHELTATPTVNGPQSKASVNGNGPPTESAPTKYTQENVVVTPSADHGPVAIMFTPFETVPMGVRDMNKVTVASESGVPPIAKDEETVPFDNKNVTEIDRVSTNPSPNTHASLRRAQNPLPRSKYRSSF